MTEAEQPERSRWRERALQGLSEGVGYGAVIGLARGIVHAVRGVGPWHLQIGGSILAGLAIGIGLCVIGRSISGRLLGSCLGALFGLFAGLFIGDAVGGYRWTTISESGGTITSSGLPIGQIIGSALGAVAGATIGAFTDRWIRGKSSRNQETPADRLQ